MTYQLFARHELFPGAVKPTTSVDSIVRLLSLMLAHTCHKESLMHANIRYGNPHRDMRIGALFSADEADLVALEEDVLKCRKGMEDNGYCVGLYVEVGRA